MDYLEHEGLSPAGIKQYFVEAMVRADSSRENCRTGTVRCGTGVRGTPCGGRGVSPRMVSLRDSSGERWRLRIARQDCVKWVPPKTVQTVSQGSLSEGRCVMGTRFAGNTGIRNSAVESRGRLTLFHRAEVRAHDTCTHQFRPRFEGTGPGRETTPSAHSRRPHCREFATAPGFDSVPCAIRRMRWE